MRTIARLSFSLLGALLLATACSSTPSASDGGGGSAPGSCNAGKNSCSPGTPFCCADYAGNFKAATVQNDCTIAMGTYSSAPCTTMNRIGSCTLYPGTAAEKTIRYYMGYNAASMSDPATNCAALHGTYAAN